MEAQTVGTDLLSPDAKVYWQGEHWQVVGPGVEKDNEPGVTLRLLRSVKGLKRTYVKRLVERSVVPSGTEVA